MKAVIITIGDEILLGQILDTNSRFIARELAKTGAETVQMRSVADERTAILRALQESVSAADAVFVTGGRSLRLPRKGVRGWRKCFLPVRNA